MRCFLLQLEACERKHLIYPGLALCLLVSLSNRQIEGKAHAKLLLKYVYAHVFPQVGEKSANLQRVDGGSSIGSGMA